MIKKGLHINKFIVMTALVCSFIFLGINTLSAQTLKADYRFQNTRSSVQIEGLQSGSCAPAPANLQAWYKGENSLTDVQSPDRSASFAGDAGYTNDGRVGRAFTFDGSGDFIESNRTLNLGNSYTIEGWIRPTGTAGFQHLVSNNNASNSNYGALFLNSSVLTYWHNGYPVVTSTTLPLNVWTHFALTYDGSKSSIYINGALDATERETHAETFNNAFRVGYSITSTNNFYAGQIDELSFYNRALAASEIASITNALGNGKCPPPVCVEAPKNLVSLYKGEVNALDSRSSNHGTNNGTTFSSGKVGQSFNFDGVDDFVSIQRSIQEDFTIEFWINTTATGGSAGQWYQGLGLVDAEVGGVTNDFGVTLGAGRVMFGTGAPDVTLTSPGVVNDGNWHHVAATRVRNTGNIKLYIDGVEVANGTGGTQSLNAPALINLGRLQTGFNYFAGKLDEVSLYSRALTAAEILSIYNADRSGKCLTALDPPSGQVAWYTADGEAVDFAGSDNNGTLNAGTNYRVGKVGQAFNFDGVDDYVRINAAPTLDVGAGNGNGMTIETWFRPNQIAQQILIEWNDGAGNIGVHIAQSSNFGGFAPGNFSVNFVDTAGGNHLIESPQNLIVAETYQHIAATYDKTTGVATLYLNGSVVASQNIGVFTPRTNTDLYLGRRISGANPFAFGGGLDETSIYNRTLSASEIAAIFNAGSDGKHKSVATNVAASTMIDLSDATVTFQNVTSPGFTSQSGVDLGLLPPLPSTVTFTGLAYDVSTTAGYQSGTVGDVQVCFNVPSLSAYNFQNLRVLHLENGSWIDRTIASTAPNLCSRTASLSPFVIVEAVAPTAASVTVAGRVTNAFGRGIKGAVITLADTEGVSRQARTNSFGYYRFEGIEIGKVYTASVTAANYSFAIGTQAISLIDAVENLNFTADAKLPGPRTRKTSKR